MTLVDAQKKAIPIDDLEEKLLAIADAVAAFAAKNIDHDLGAKVDRAATRFGAREAARLAMTDVHFVERCDADRVMRLARATV